MVYGIVGPQEKLQTTAKDIYITGSVNDSTDGNYEIKIYLHNTGRENISFDDVSAEIGPERSDMGPGLGFKVFSGNTTVQPGQTWQREVTIENPAAEGIDASCICINFFQGDQKIIAATGRVPDMSPDIGVPSAMEYKLM